MVKYIHVHHEGTPLNRITVTLVQFVLEFGSNYLENPF